MRLENGREGNRPPAGQGIDADCTSSSRTETAIQMKKLLEHYGELADNEEVVGSIPQTIVGKRDTKL